MQIFKFSDKNSKKLLILAIFTLIFSLAYLFYGLKLEFLDFFIANRIKKLAAILLVAYAIGSATMVFQTIINNNIVTPCLLGMNALYLVIHTAIFFFLGSANILVTNIYASFACDILAMSVVASLIYGFLFRVTKYNVLYVLLAGTVMATFFTSLQKTLVRIMDPADYDMLLNSLVASFSHVNTDILGIAFVLTIIVTLIYKKDLALLDAIALGKEKAINLGIDYDKTIARLLLGVVLYITVATALVGPISFLGLIIANLAREIFKTYRHSYLVIGSALVGMVALTAGQFVVERVFVLSIPIVVFVNIVGGIYFLYLLLKNKGN
ncbi:MAG: iron chelate uptake ABC transporter family permease subunit [Campylobacter sp.]|nr:iron chelate uptake ABC transporter family permease subunit [Campylobacter sp.]MBP3724927.1 iron chelate uptake ABC transporter family permease subunit [Campylobacter sp.]